MSVFPLFAISMVLVLVSTDYPDVFARIVGTLGLHLTQAIAMVMVLGLGFGAYKFKLNNKFLYGALEVLFGISSSITIVSRVHFTSIPVSQMSLAQVIALVGSTYVVARGLSNMHEARGKP